jgi:VCBS repeat-containing protein
VTSVNDLPQAVNDTYATVAGATLEVNATNGVLANDVDPDGDSLTATLVTDVTSGTLSLNADGSFTYAPPAGFSGTQQFVYRASDGTGNSNEATVTLTINAANTFSLLENAPAGTLVGMLQLGNSDLDGDLIFEFVDEQLNPRLELAADDHLAGALAAPVVMIEYLDLQCPTCAAVHPLIEQVKSEFADELLVVSRHFPLLTPHPNAFDAAVASEAAARQGRFHEFVDLMFTKQDEWADEANPRSLFESYADELDLNLTQFSADLDDTVLVARVQRDLEDIVALGGTGTPTFYVNGTRVTELPADVQGYRDLVEDALEQFDDVFTINRRTGQIVVADADALDFSTTPTYTLNVRVSDRDGDTETIQARINLVDVNQTPPVAIADSYSVDEEIVLTVNAANGILANDSDPDGDQLVPRIDSNPANGTLVVNLDGSFTYTPNTDFSGQDSFVYQASDGDFLSDLTTVTITVNNVNDAPQVVDDAYTLSENETLQVNAVNGVLANDADVDGDSLTVTLVDDVSNGALVLNADGSFTYTPTASFSGSDSFTYRVNDGTVDSAEAATVSLTISNVNQAPIARADAYVAQVGQPLQVAAALGLLANDSDPDGDSLTVIASTQPINGEVLVGGDGTFQYTPDTGYTGTDTFTYRISDGDLESTNVIVTVTVNPQNTFSLPEDARQGDLVGTVQSVSAALSAPVMMELADASRPAALGLVPDDHLSGDITAPVVLIEYLDFQCPTCRAFHPVVKALEEQFEGELLVVRRHFPLQSIHPNAFAAGVAAEAAGRQDAFEAFGDLLFENQPTWAPLSDPQPLFESYATSLGLNLDQFRTDQADPALAARVQRDLDATAGLGATGTPTFFLQGSRLNPLPSTQPVFASLIQDAVNAVDDVFRLNRRTGELTVRTASALDFETNPQLIVPISIRDLDGDVETLNATVNLVDVNDQAEGAVLSAPAVDSVLMDEFEWLA